MNLKNSIFNNLTLKIISIMLAVVLWVYVQGESRSEIIFNLPLNIIKAPNMTIFGDVPDYIRITLKGRRNIINGLTKEQFKIELDLSDREPSKISYPLSPKNISGPKDIDIVNIEPNQVTVDLDYLVTKEVPIRAITTGNLAPNFIIYDRIIVPPTVIIEGAERELKLMSYVETIPIVVDGLSDNLTREVNLKQERTIKIKNVTTAKVTIVLWKEKKFPQHEITLMNLDKSLQARIIPETVSITLHGIQKQVDMLQSNDVRITADLDELPPGNYQRKLEVSVPPGIEYSDYNPKSVNVTIKKKE